MPAKINQPSNPLTTPPVKKSSYEKYQDPEGELTTGKFKFEFWYVRNKILLYRLSVIGLIVFSAINFAYSILTFGYFLVIGMAEDNIMYQQLSYFPNYVGFHEHFSPQPLQILAVHVLPSGVKKYDVVAEVANPNDRFIVSFTYFFTVNGVPTKKQTVSILPAQLSLVPFLGIENDSGALQADLVIENTAWKRVSNHVIRDVVAWQNERLNFLVSDFQFTAAGNQEGAPNAHVVKFKLNNASPFGYKEVDFYVGLYQEQVLSEIIPAKVSKFNSLEVRDMDLRSFVPGMFASQIKIYPNVNLYDSDIYLPPPV